MPATSSSTRSQQSLVVGLDHDPNSGSVPDGAHQQPAAAVEAQLGSLDAALDRRLRSSGWPPFRRQLRSRCGSGSNARPKALSGRSCRAHHREHLQPGEQAVAGGREVGHDDVAGLLAAEVVAGLRICSTT